jgi:hypothetical protein
MMGCFWLLSLKKLHLGKYVAGAATNMPAKRRIWQKMQTMLWKMRRTSGKSEDCGGRSEECRRRSEKYDGSSDKSVGECKKYRESSDACLRSVLLLARVWDEFLMLLPSAKIFS